MINTEHYAILFLSFVLLGAVLYGMGYCLKKRHGNNSETNDGKWCGLLQCNDGTFGLKTFIQEHIQAFRDSINDSEGNPKSLSGYVIENTSVLNTCCCRRSSADDKPFATRRARYWFELFITIGISALFGAISASGSGCTETTSVSYCNTSTCSGTYYCGGVSGYCEEINGQCTAPYSGCSQLNCYESSSYSAASSTSTNSCMDLDFTQGVEIAFPITLLTFVIKKVVDYGVDKIVEGGNIEDLKLHNPSGVVEKDSEYMTRTKYMTFEYILIFLSFGTMAICIFFSFSLDIGDKPESYRVTVIAISAILTSFLEVPSDVGQYIIYWLIGNCLLRFRPALSSRENDENCRRMT